MNWSHNNQKFELAILLLKESFPHEFPQIINIPVTESEAFCTIPSLKNNTSRGYDGLPSKTLKW